MGRSMLRHLRSHVIAYVALFFALTGTAVALPGHNSVFSDDIKDGQVKAADIREDAVGSSELRTDAVGSAVIRAGAVGSSEIADLAVTTGKLGGDSVTAPKLANTTDGLTTQNLPANSTVNVTATCPAGGQAISGGYFTPASGVVQVTRMRRDSDNTWVFTFRNTAATVQGVDARVTCLVG
jgi:hypothetical protein